MFSEYSLPLTEKFKNPQRDSNISTTNQTSVEASIDEILNQTNENFTSSIEEQKSIKGPKEKNFRPLSESKKNPPVQTRHCRYTDITKSGKFRPGSAEKYKSNLSIEGKPKKSEPRMEGIHKSQFLEAAKFTKQRSLKLKQFTPILSGKRIKLTRLDEIESIEATNSKKPDKIEPKTQSISSKIIEIASHIEKIDKISEEFKPKVLEKSQAVFLSPLRNLKNFQNVNETGENPYANFSLSPNLKQILEDLQQNLKISSESESEESPRGHVDLPDLPFHHKLKNREPSFGFGGGEFLYEDTQNSEETLYYDPSTSESEKFVQTEQKSDLKSILSIVTNQEFINSLKIIGKFASFIENNLVVN